MNDGFTLVEDHPQIGAFDDISKYPIHKIDEPLRGLIFANLTRAPKDQRQVAAKRIGDVLETNKNGLDKEGLVSIITVLNNLQPILEVSKGKDYLNTFMRISRYPINNLYEFSRANYFLQLEDTVKVGDRRRFLKAIKHETTIPNLDISDEKLNQLKGRIKPVVEMDNGVLYYIEDVEPRNTVFTWEPRYTEQAKDIVPFKTIITYHKYGAPSIFKPSIAEVLSQIPERHLEKTVAYRVHSEGLDRRNVISNNSCHITATTLYKKQSK